MTYEYNVTTGDKISVKVDTTGGYKTTSDLPFEITKDGEVVSQGTFIQGDAYEQYLVSVEKDENAKVLDSGKKDGNEYLFWSYNDEEYDYAIKIADSDTGLVLGNQISEESAKDCFDRITIRKVD